MNRLEKHSKLSLKLATQTLFRIVFDHFQIHCNQETHNLKDMTEAKVNHLYMDILAMTWNHKNLKGKNGNTLQLLWWHLQLQVSNQQFGSMSTFSLGEW